MRVIYSLNSTHTLLFGALGHLPVASSTNSCFPRPEERTEEELFLLDDIITHTKILSRLSMNKRGDLCRCMRRRSLEIGEVLFRQARALAVL